MSPIEVLSSEDPRLEPFSKIRHRNWTQQSGIFVVEGPLLVERLLASDFTCKSILLDRKYLARFESMVPPDVELLLVSHELIEQIIGFNFHRGILACGQRRPRQRIQDQFLPAHSRETLVGLEGVQDPENVGGILRNCAALGIRRIVIGGGCADPFSRRALRVSMGTTLKLEIFTSEHLVDDMQWLEREHGIQSYATCLTENSSSLATIRYPHPALVLFGNEKQGLAPEILRVAHNHIKIDMHLGVDSFNVCVASGIILHYFCRLASAN